MRFLIVFVLLVGLSACQSVQLEPKAYNFQSSSDAAQDALAEVFLRDGFRLKSDSTRQLIVEKPVRGIGAAFVFGSNWNSVPNARVSFAFTGDQPVTVYVTSLMITNPNSGFERETDLTHSDKDFTVIEAAVLEARQIAENRTNQ